MSGLREEEAEELVRSPAERARHPLDNEDVAEIHAIAGTLPFFLQATAAHWFRQKQRYGGVDPEVALGELVKELSPFFSQWWRQFNEVGRELLIRIARQQPLGQLPFSTTEINGTRRRLKSYGVLEEKSGSLVLNGLLFETWLRESSGRGRTTVNAHDHHQERNGQQVGPPGGQRGGPPRS
jgi:hypothetical protein